MQDFAPMALKMLSFGCLAAAMGGCAASSSVGRPETSYTPVITEEAMLTAARANSDSPIEAAASSGCPPVQVEGGQRYVTIYEGNRVGDGASVIHRAEITKTARECQIAAGVAQVKYGIAGRVLLGPKGKPGTVTLPATMQVFDKARNKVKSEPISVTVTISRENPLSYFSIVHDVTIPVKEGATAQDYIISIAFEKKGAA